MPVIPGTPDPLINQVIKLTVTVQCLELKAAAGSGPQAQLQRVMAEIGRGLIRRALSVVEDDQT